MKSYLSLPKLEEYDFLNQICLTALSANKHVNFGAVVDKVGKLIVARLEGSLFKHI